MMKKILLATALSVFALATMGQVQAAPIDVTDTVTGGPGAWIYDFSVTNNLGGSNDIYFFGVQVSVTNVTSSPSNWGFATWDTPWNDSGLGGSNTVYNNTWCCTFGGIAPGYTLSGFEVTDTAATADAQVAWFAFASGGTYDGSGSFSNPSNPGFEGFSASAAVPEPASIAVLAAALAGAGIAARRRRSALSAG